MKEKTMFEEMRESGSKLPDIVEFIQANGWKTKNHHDNWVKVGTEGEYSTHEAYRIALSDANTIKEAVKIICNALMEDKSEGSYYHAWQCNIAMAFKDEIARLDPVTRRWDKEIVHRVANQAAKDFLDILIKQ
jgi:hypothetical protein